MSHISMHNASNHALRRVLTLDGMAEELRRDTAEIDAYLQEAAAKRTEKRFRWVSILGGACLIAKELLEVSKDLTKGLFAVSVGVIVGVIAGG